jgi:hypothetical protein
MVETANIKAADPRNYQTPGKVSLWFRKKGSTAYSDWKEFGNVISPAIASELARLDHWSQRRGLRAKDRSIITERTAQLNFTLDEINLDNLQFMFGSSATPAAGSFLKNNSKVLSNPGGGGTIDLGETNIVEASVVVRDPRIESPTIYTVSTDYTVTAAAGTLGIEAGGALNDAGAVPEVHVFWQKSVTTQKFNIFTGAEIEGEAKFQVFTPGGIQYAVVMSNIILRNNGDITLGDGTTWQEVPLQLDILVDANDVLGECHIVDAADEL